MEMSKHVVFNLGWVPWWTINYLRPVLGISVLWLLFKRKSIFCFCKFARPKYGLLEKKIAIFASPKDKICQGFQFLVLHSILFFRIKLFVRSLLFGLVNLQDQQKMNTFKTKWILFHFFLFKVFIFSSCELIRQKKVSLKRSTLFGLAKL
jgi:hypothetical protein